jgi:hypothetical protein
MKAMACLGLVAFLGLSVAGGAGGCGQSVATCDSVCLLPGAPTSNDCSSSCTQAQTACASSDCSGDFQLYLTCLQNAGTYAAVDGLCATIAATVATESSVPVGVPVDAGVTGSCASASCASVCATEGSAVESCTMGCETAQQECANFADTFQALLSCFCEAGGLIDNPPLQCTAQVNAIEQECATTGTSPGTGVGVGPGVGGFTDAGVSPGVVGQP